MKKLMIALAAVAVAAGVQAASFNWKNTSGAPATKIFQSDGTTGVAEGTVAYLFCTADITQDKLLEAVRGGDALSKYAINGANNVVNSSSKINSLETAFDYGSVGGTYTFYYALINGDEMLISDTASGQGQQGATETIGFNSSSTWSKVVKGDAAYSAAGWYNTVPEPTSGLLLLLGVAGLALKRKRA